MATTASKACSRIAGQKEQEATYETTLIGQTLWQWLWFWLRQWLWLWLWLWLWQ